MQEISIDDAEEQITSVLTREMGPISMLPVLDENGDVVDQAYPHVDLYRYITNEKYPELFRVICGKVLVLLEGTRLRIFQTFNEALDFTKGLSGRKTIFPGPSFQKLTLVDLESSEEE